MLFRSFGLFRYDRNTDKFEQYCVDKTGRSLKGKNINSICNYGDWIAMAIHEGELMKYNPSTNQLVKKIYLRLTIHLYVMWLVLTMNCGWELMKAYLL